MPENMSEPNSEMPPARGTSWVIGQVVLFCLFIVSLVGGNGIPDIPGIVFAQIVGVVVALGGAALSVWAFLHHGADLTPFPRPNAGQQLIDVGPYRYVRHPMYSGIVAFTLGVGLAYANPITVLCSFAFVVFFMAKTGYEEELLVAHVEGYREYRSSVPWRLIPYLL